MDEKKDKKDNYVITKDDPLWIKPVGRKKALLFYNKGKTWMTSVHYINQVIRGSRAKPFVGADRIHYKIGRPVGVVETKPRKRKKKKNIEGV